MIVRSRIKWAALGVIVLSLVSLFGHLHFAKYSNSDLLLYSAMTGFGHDFSVNVGGRQDAAYRKLWGNVKSLEPLQPYANPRSKYPVPTEQNNGFIFAKVFGGFEKIRNSICDLVTISRLLNATLVIPEIQESTRSKGISSKFRSFSYIYNEEQFIAALSNDVSITKSLPPKLKDIRKQKQHPTFKPKSSATPGFYINEVLPQLKKAKFIELVLTDGGCLQPILPPGLDEFQRLRCRVAFHALQFRPEILALGQRMVERLHASGQPYLAFHPALVRDTLAFQGCAELFQDVHTEIIQYRRAQMIKQGIVKDELIVDSFARKANGSCPLMPEEVGLLFQAMGYPDKTRIYLAGSEIFGGHRVLIPLRAMYSNLVDRTSLCSKQELNDLIGPEMPLPLNEFQPPPAKTVEQLKREWDKAGPRPRPLPPPPDRPIYRHEKEGWYGWVAEADSEPDPSPIGLRVQAHRLLWAALDFIVSVQADAFFPGFTNDGSGPSGWPDFSGLVMGHRLYEMGSARTYRPDRKYVAKLFSNISENLYHPKNKWKLLSRKHLNESLGEEGLLRESRLSKPTSFLSHPIPECACRTVKYVEKTGSNKGSNRQHSYGGEVECPSWMENSISTASIEESSMNDNEPPEDESENLSDSAEEGSTTDSTPPPDQDEEMDPDD